MKLFLLYCGLLTMGTCWRYHPVEPPERKVWGNRPVYAAENKAREISYIAGKQPIVQAGNIYAIGPYIFQVDVGRGIHVIDNRVPAQADRVGFIRVYGCAQVAIRGNHLYTNSLSDLVTLDLSDPARLKEVSRVANAFPSFRYNYPLVQPEERGYFACPRYDSIVVGWVKDSVYASCYKN
ncbi:hypothetical protein V9K67_16305 [Paraflavisolibacter sp. H34]|uniref:hypothetical protein n=1 Tax=Huijunlia imazamoxiresistens TaxID=3127457 RepID=UPI00301A7EC5